MRLRPLGRTGLRVSEIAFGAWQLGNPTDWAAMDDRTAHRLVHEAIDLGINLFDTAPNYASTNSERLLGEALVGKRHDAVVVSKFGHPPEGAKDFSVQQFWPSLEASLRRLRTDHLDVLLLHNPEMSMYEGTDPLWEALEMAVQQGKIRYYGASLDYSPEIEACLTNTRSTVLEILFNILHQDARKAFASIKNRECGTIVKVPLDSGWLTGRFDANSHFDGVRSRWKRQQIVQRAKLVGQLDWLVADGSPLATRALGFVLAYDEVSCVIPGVRNSQQLRSNVQAADSPLTAAQRKRLEVFWDDFASNGKTPLPW